MLTDREKLFAAHHPDKQFIPKNCIHSYTDALSIASMIKSPEHFTPPFSHIHEEYEFLLPQTPIPMIIYNDAVYFGEVGYAYPVQSGRFHATYFHACDIAHDNIVVRKGYMEKLLEQQGMRGEEFNARFPVTRELKLYIQLFKKEFARGEPRSGQKLEHLSALLCITLIELGAGKPFTPKSPQEYQRGIQSIAEYLNRHYRDNISTEELAAMCGLSKNYFITAFKKTVGESPYSYVNKLRVSQAKVLLEATTYSVSEIAQKCGFQKSNTFTSLFRSATGMSPTQYREFARQ